MADDMRDAGDTPEVALDLDEQNDGPGGGHARRGGGGGGRRDEAPGRTARRPGGADEVSRLRQEVADLRDRSCAPWPTSTTSASAASASARRCKRYALLEPMREFLTVVDNLDLALSAQGLRRRPEARRRDDPPPDDELLRRFGVTEVPAVGAAVRPDRSTRRWPARRARRSSRPPCRPSCGAATCCTTACCVRRW